jgi:transposase
VTEPGCHRRGCVSGRRASPPVAARGVDIAAAEVIVAEAGVDMSHFPPAVHLVSWAARSPRSEQGAGKRRNTRIGVGGPCLKATLVEAAWASTPKRDRRLQRLLRRLTGKRGPEEAIIAVAAEIVRSIRCMPTRDEVYKEPDPTWADPTREEREAKCLVQELGELGYEVAVRVTAK